MESKQQTAAESRQLLAFAREPVLGRVKTRSAAGIGAGPALAVYRELLTDADRLPLRIARLPTLPDVDPVRDLEARRR